MQSRPQPDFVDQGLLVDVYGRPYGTEMPAAERAVKSWGYAEQGGAHHRTWVFQPYEGPMSSKLVRGGPAEGVYPREIYGFDGEDRIVLARGLSGERLVEQTAVRHERDVKTGVTYMRDPAGQWAPEIAFYERYTAGRLVESGVYGVHAGLVGQKYRYDAAGQRVVELIERRSEPFADESVERRLHMQYGEDGKAEVLTEGGSVLWRRRKGAKERRAALEVAEDRLLGDLAATIRGLYRDGPLAVVMLRHQDDGDWLDQALPDVSAKRELRAPASGAHWEDTWSEEEWEMPSLPARYDTATLQALEDLEVTGAPIEDEPRALLRRVATRLRGAATSSGHELLVVVTGHDPEDLRHDVLKSITSDQRDRLASLGWL